jgi:hypothetical protein
LPFDAAADADEPVGMDTALPLHPLHSLLPLDQPFTPAMARAVGIERSALDRMVRDGLVRRVLRGVYAASTAPDCVALRAAAVGLVVGGRGIVVDRTAGWVHGVRLSEAVPLDVLVPGRSQQTSLGGRRHLVGRDTTLLCGLRIATPLRTALDLGRLLPPGPALGAMDALLAGGTFTHPGLLGELARFAGHRGIGQLRSLAAQVDARSTGLAESVLRLHWNAANLPTPVPGMPVAAGARLVRLSLGVERRQFGAVLAHQVSAADLVALQGAGWWVVVLAEERVLSTDPSIWTRHLEREFHQHLVAQMDGEEEVG